MTTRRWITMAGAVERTSGRGQDKKKNSSKEERKRLKIVKLGQLIRKTQEAN